jgi:protoporphyrinogen oxidase
MVQKHKHIVILGAGPAGLSAAWELVQQGIRVSILEKEPYIGGMCRTKFYDTAEGIYRFDLGGHRFITHNAELLNMVGELLGDEMLTSIRQSAIRFRGRIYDYPLSIKNLLMKASWRILVGCLLDWIKLNRCIPEEEISFDGWMKNRFGKTLYEHFFHGYTKKLWGIDPENLSSDWASQRISLLNLNDVVKRLIPKKSDTPRTYAKQYRYPKYGFGQIFVNLSQQIKKNGGEIFLSSPVVDSKASNNQIVQLSTSGSHQKNWYPDFVISTIPINEMVTMTGGKSSLRFRSLRFLNMAFDEENISPYTWQYLSDPDMLATRLQEPKRRSPFMSPPGKSSLMLEIPCQEKDSIWEMTEVQLLERVKPSLNALGIDTRKITHLFKSTYASNAYPVMDLDYKDERERAIRHLSSFRNLVMCGRQGTFRYIFCDTAMEMGRIAARGIINKNIKQHEIFNHRNEKTVIELQSVA